MTIDSVGCVSTMSPLSSFLIEPCCGSGIMPFSTKPYVSHHSHGDPIALPAIGFERECASTFGETYIWKGVFCRGLWKRSLHLFHDTASCSAGSWHDWNETGFLWSWEELAWGWQIRRVKMEASMIKVKRSLWYYWVAEQPALELPHSSVYSCRSYKHPCNIGQFELGVSIVGCQCYPIWLILHLCLKVGANTVMASKWHWMNKR